jgi:hypothetical protein
MHFESVAQLISPQATTESLEENLRAAQKRVGEAQAIAFRDGNTEFVARLSEAGQKLEEVGGLIDACSGGDVDAGQRAMRMLLDVDATLAEINAEQSWPELESDAYDTQAWAMALCASLGKPSEQRLLDRAGESLQRAVSRKNVVELMRQLRIIRRIGGTCYRRDPESWVQDFNYCVSRIEETTDLPKARELANQGETAIARDDTAALRKVVKDLWDLMPTDPVARRMGYESGLR